MFGGYQWVSESEPSPAASGGANTFSSDVAPAASTVEKTPPSLDAASSLMERDIPEVETDTGRGAKREESGPNRRHSGQQQITPTVSPASPSQGSETRVLAAPPPNGPEEAASPPSADASPSPTALAPEATPPPKHEPESEEFDPLSLRH
jgi:hypothetical protein